MGLRVERRCWRTRPRSTACPVACRSAAGSSRRPRPRRQRRRGGCPQPAGGALPLPPVALLLPLLLPPQPLLLPPHSLLIPQLPLPVPWRLVPPLLLAPRRWRLRLGPTLVLPWLPLLRPSWPLPDVGWRRRRRQCVATGPRPFPERGVVPVEVGSHGSHLACGEFLAGVPSGKGLVRRCTGSRLRAYTYEMTENMMLSRGSGRPLAHVLCCPKGQPSRPKRASGLRK